MHPTTEELLNTFLWMAELAMAPTMANLMKTSQNSVTYQQLHRLEHGDMLTRSRNDAGRWVYRLTRRGKLAALGGRHPEQAWARPWNRRWTFLLFDIPSTAPATRARLLYWLRANHFGCLQKSVWITPDPGKTLSRRMKEDIGKPDSILVVEGAPARASGKKTAEMIQAAWDFDEINRRYKHYLSIAAEKPNPASITAWRAQEHRSWRQAIQIDPLLPKPLLPSRYLGKRAWTRRRSILQLHTAAQARTPIIESGPLT